MIEIPSQFEEIALLLIDMHRGHMDPEVATLPVEASWAKEVLAQTKALLEGLRALDTKIVHVTTWNRVDKNGVPVDSLSTVNPYYLWRTQTGRVKVVQKAAKYHNIEGSVQTQFMPEVQPLPGEYTIVKKRYNAFHGTDLDLLLRCLRVNTLIVAGVNTNNCITATTADGCVRDYGMLVVSDCVASSYGRHMHDIALELIQNTFGWVMSSKDVLEIMKAKKSPEIRR